jgi:hypothetical protein
VVGFLIKTTLGLGTGSLEKNGQKAAALCLDALMFSLAFRYKDVAWRLAKFTGHTLLSLLASGSIYIRIAFDFSMI